MNESNGSKNNLNEREEYECPECGRDCGQKVKGEVGTCWHFYCEYCGIDFGGDL